MPVRRHGTGGENFALAPAAEIGRRRPHVVEHRSVHFGEIRAELFLCRSNQYDELEVFAQAHVRLTRCGGAASCCEIVWRDNGHRKRLSELRQNGILFSPACSRVLVSKEDDGRYGFIALQIAPAALATVSDHQHDALQPALAPRAGTGQPELSRVIETLRDEIERPGPAGLLYKETLALQLLIRLLRCSSNPPLAPAKGGLAAWRLRRAIELLEYDLTQSPSLGELAAQAGLSPAYFCAAFRQSTGQPPHRYLLNRRIAHAKRLMANAALSLAEIARDSGFGSASHFATAFKRIVGRTPSAYRRGL
jgi:AraC family transcriptional regulator